MVDDNFTLNLKRVETICDILVSENIDLPWNSQNGIRADRINDKLAKKMAESGVVWDPDNYVRNKDGNWGLITDKEQEKTLMTETMKRTLNL